MSKFTMIEGMLMREAISLERAEELIKANREEVEGEWFQAIINGWDGAFEGQ